MRKQHLELIGTPEVTRRGVNKKASRAKEPSGKLVSIKVSEVKTSLLQCMTHAKSAVLGVGLLYFWEDVAAYADPMQIHLAWVLGLVIVVESLTYKFSKIQ